MTTTWQTWTTEKLTLMKYELHQQQVTSRPDK